MSRPIDENKILFTIDVPEVPIQFKLQHELIHNITPTLSSSELKEERERLLSLSEHNIPNEPYNMTNLGSTQTETIRPEDMTPDMFVSMELATKYQIAIEDIIMYYRLRERENERMQNQVQEQNVEHRNTL